MIEGKWEKGWDAVVDAFAANFADAGEQGAALSIYRHGTAVVNIWGGTYTNVSAQIADAPWQQDTCVNIFSAGKGLVALCVLQLAAAGRLDLDAPVADYWPEFAAANKSAISVRQVLCHRSGLSAFHDTLPSEHIYDWAAMCGAIEALTPWWQPGEAQGYSPFIFGWILGELVRRVSGCDSFDSYFQRAVAQPLKADCFFGLDDRQLAKVADVTPLKQLQSARTCSGADSVALGKIMKADPRGVTNRAFGNPLSLLTSTNSALWRKAQIPAANCHATAHGLASVYGALGADMQTDAATKLLPAEQRTLCWQEQSAEQDKVLGLPLRFSNGFMLPAEREDCRMGRGLRAFGHPGAGGCLGFADPDYGLGFGYVTSRMGQSLLVDQRAARLIDAAYYIMENTDE